MPPVITSGGCEARRRASRPDKCRIPLHLSTVPEHIVHFGLPASPARAASSGPGMAGMYRFTHGFASTKIIYRNPSSRQPQELAQWASHLQALIAQLVRITSKRQESLVLSGLLNTNLLCSPLAFLRLPPGSGIHFATRFCQSTCHFSIF